MGQARHLQPVLPGGRNETVAGMEAGGKQAGLDAVLEARDPFLAALALLVQPRPSVPASTNMGIRDSITKLKKEISRPRSGSRRKTGAEAGGERLDSIDSPPSSEPHITAGGGNRSRANTGGWHVHGTDRPRQTDSPEPVVTHVGESDRGGREADVDGGETSKRHWFGIGSRPSRDGNHADVGMVGRVYPSPSASPVPLSTKPNSM